MYSRRALTRNREFLNERVERDRVYPATRIMRVYSTRRSLKYVSLLAERKRDRVTRETNNIRFPATSLRNIIATFTIGLRSVSFDCATLLLKCADICPVDVSLILPSLSPSLRLLFYKDRALFRKRVRNIPWMLFRTACYYSRRASASFLRCSRAVKLTAASTRLF